MDGIVRRSQLLDKEGGIETARNYSDLGMDVQVAAPTSPTAGLRELVD